MTAIKKQQMTESVVIAAKVCDPRQPSIFGKSKKSERATYTEILCSCESCPLRAKRECVQTHIFGQRCPYGRLCTKTGPTQRARGYCGWVSEHKKEAEKHGGWMKFAANKLAFIGDYVYLPYAYADMCEDIPFLKHSSVFSSGSPFIPRNEWTLDAVLVLIDFRPRALMGGEITAYRKEQLPRFISHIREVDPAMWTLLIKARPDLDKAPDYVGRRAMLSTLRHPITIPPCDNRYPVSWLWNGETLTTTDSDSYSGTWGNVKPESLVLTLIPKKDTTVIVADNSWVSDATVFVD